MDVARNERHQKRTGGAMYNFLTLVLNLEDNNTLCL